jgi:hypothetical protein
MIRLRNNVLFHDSVPVVDVSGRLTRVGVLDKMVALESQAVGDAVASIVYLEFRGFVVKPWWCSFDKGFDFLGIHCVSHKLQKDRHSFCCI